MPAPVSSFCRCRRHHISTSQRSADFGVIVLAPVSSLPILASSCQHQSAVCRFRRHRVSTSQQSADFGVIVPAPVSSLPISVSSYQHQSAVCRCRRHRANTSQQSADYGDVLSEPVPFDLWCIVCTQPHSSFCFLCCCSVIW